MILKCTSKGTYTDLTEGKMYEVKHEYNGQYYVLDDNKDWYYYKKNCFVVICEDEEEMLIESQIAILEERINKDKEELQKLVDLRNQKLK